MTYNCQDMAYDIMLSTHDNNNILIGLHDSIMCFVWPYYISTLHLNIRKSKLQDMSLYYRGCDIINFKIRYQIINIFQSYYQCIAL